MSWSLVLALASAPALAAPTCPLQAPQGAPFWVAVERNDTGDIVGRTPRDTAGHPDGLQCRWYDFGARKSETWWRNGKRDGVSLTWSPEGDLIQVETWEAGDRHGPIRVLSPRGGWQVGGYKDGLKHGEWRHIDNQGRLRDIESWSWGLEHGPHTAWDEFGDELYYFTFDSGVMNGTYRLNNGIGGLEVGQMADGEPVGDWSIYRDGQLSERGPFVDAHRHGVWEVWLHDTLVSETTYARGVKQGPYRRYVGEAIYEIGEYDNDEQTGAWELYDLQTGLIQQRTTYERGQPSGPFEAWDREGETISKGELADGARTGLWEERASEGGRWRGSYDESMRHGVWERYVDGQLVESIDYAYGARHGPSQVYIDGQVVEDCSYRDDRNHGACKRFHPTGELRELWTWSRGQLDGPYGLWDEAGRSLERGAYERGQLHGKFERWEPGGQLAERGSYEGGVQTGEWVWFHDNGQRKKLGRYDAQGLRTGIWTEYHRSGAVAARGKRIADMRFGTWTSWYANGSVQKQGPYADDLRNGDWTWYWLTGGQKKRGRYVDGIKNGHWRMWGPTGKLLLELDYMRGEARNVQPPPLIEGADPDPFPDEEDGLHGIGTIGVLGPSNLNGIGTPNRDPNWYKNQADLWFGGREGLSDSLP